jgi:hypothetical protein
MEAHGLRDVFGQIDVFGAHEWPYAFSTQILMGTKDPTQD